MKSWNIKLMNSFRHVQLFSREFYIKISHRRDFINQITIFLYLARSGLRYFSDFGFDGSLDIFQSSSPQRAYTQSGKSNATRFSKCRDSIAKQSTGHKLRGFLQRSWSRLASKDDRNCDDHYGHWSNGRTIGLSSKCGHSCPGNHRLCCSMIPVKMLWN